MARSAAAAWKGAVIEEALGSLRDGAPRLLKFGVADDMAWEVGLTCGGSIEVYVEPLDETYWRALADLSSADRYGAALTVVDGERAGEKLLLDAAGAALYQTANLSESLAADLRGLARDGGKTGLAQLGDSRVMIDTLQQRPHLILVGGVHVSIPLAAMAGQIGWRVSIVDPRAPLLPRKSASPKSPISCTAIPTRRCRPSGWTAAPTWRSWTHDPKIDDKALLTALPAGIPYVGVLSSGRTHRQRVARLRGGGLGRGGI